LKPTVIIVRTPSAASTRQSRTTPTTIRAFRPCVSAKPLMS
jgi:hypothetical protein